MIHVNAQYLHVYTATSLEQFQTINFVQFGAGVPGHDRWEAEFLDGLRF